MCNAGSEVFVGTHRGGFSLFPAPLFLDLCPAWMSLPAGTENSTFLISQKLIFPELTGEIFAFPPSWDGVGSQQCGVTSHPGAGWVWRILVGF